MTLANPLGSGFGTISGFRYEASAASGISAKNDGICSCEVIGLLARDSITLADLALYPGLHLRDDEVNASLFA
ncbi:hypothetical protein D3C80_2067030 [compost metagenome]